jgi:hypothetical protein
VQVPIGHEGAHAVLAQSRVDHLGQRGVAPVNLDPLFG